MWFENSLLKEYLSFREDLSILTRTEPQIYVRFSARALQRNVSFPKLSMSKTVCEFTHSSSVATRLNQILTFFETLFGRCPSDESARN